MVKTKVIGYKPFHHLEPDHDYAYLDNALSNRFIVQRLDPDNMPTDNKPRPLPYKRKPAPPRKRGSAMPEADMLRYRNRISEPSIIRIDYAKRQTTVLWVPFETEICSTALVRAANAYGWSCSYFRQAECFIHFDCVPWKIAVKTCNGENVARKTFYLTDRAGYLHCFLSPDDMEPGAKPLFAFGERDYVEVVFSREKVVVRVNKKSACELVPNKMKP